VSQSENEITPISSTITLPNLPANLFLLDPSNRNLISIGHRRFKFLNDFGPPLLLAVLMLVPVLMVMEGIGALTGDFKLARSSHIGQGEITHRRSTTAGGGSQATTYFVAYRFSTGEFGVSYSNEQVVDKTVYRRLVEGTQVNVKYVFDDPQISRLTDSNIDNTLQDMGSTVGWLGLIGTLITGGFAIMQLKRFRDEYRLRHLGRLLIGHVNHCYGNLKVGSRSFAANDYGSVLHGKYIIELYYRFRTPDNHEIRRREVRRRNDLLGAVLPGPDTPIAVLYLDIRHYKVL